jgi:hypothetical protein
MKKAILFILFSICLSACASGYQPSGGGYVFVSWNESAGKVEVPVVGADRATFEIFDQNGYAKDAQQVYFEGRTVEGAQAATFEAVSKLYGKDAAGVYYQGRVLPGAEPGSFKVINLQWGQDAGDVYFQDRPLEACDPETFELLKDSWQKDSQCAYREGRKLPNADAASFEVLNYWFAKDRYQVYDDIPRVIPGADAATFKLRPGICQVCAQDKNHCYSYEKVVACEGEN